MTLPDIKDYLISRNYKRHIFHETLKTVFPLHKMSFSADIRRKILLSNPWLTQKLLGTTRITRRDRDLRITEGPRFPNYPGSG